ncbi:MAG: hypothetical protein IJJ16_00475 [Mogibacterium sp.]|nr:hypothetical protein [Mogibacterium sp.]
MKDDRINSIMDSDKTWERPATNRPRMPRSQRAKQFAPFDALSGLSEILRQAEEEHAKEQERK